jgi:WhiB family transcriptional regulator, redox-sensing transcriptional regulator
VVTKLTHWQKAAACRGEARVDFYPPFGRERKRDRVQREQRAKAVCSTCPVTSSCLEAAMRADERHGVWGGLTFDERITFRKSA